MERFQELREVAQKKLIIADHMLTQTYNVVHEPKMLYFVLENVFLSMTSNMSAVLEFERTFKRIGAFPDNFESKLNLFATRIVPKHKVSSTYLEIMRDLKDLTIKHKESPVEFSRKDKFVICDDDFKCKALTVPEIKKYIEIGNQFIADTEKLFLDKIIFEAKK